MAAILVDEQSFLAYLQIMSGFHSSLSYPHTQNTGGFRRLGRHIFHGTLFEAVFCPVNNIF